MNEKNKIPNIRFKGFSGEWEEKKLYDISESFDYGLNAAATEYDGKNKYIRITDINEDSHVFNINDLTSPNTDLNLAENYKLNLGDILFARTGASVGKSYIYKEEDGLVYYAGFLIRARIKKEVNAEFVFQNTLTKKYNKFVRLTSQRSGQPGINAHEYSNYNITLPSKNEQTKIGNYFQQLDKLINLHHRKYDKLLKVKKAMLEKMFPKNGEDVPEIRFKGFSEKWEERELGEVAKITMGQSPNGVNYTNNPEDNILVQGNADMKNGLVVPRIWTKQITKTADIEDLIFSVRAPVGEIGKTTYNVVIGRGVAAIKGNEFVFQSLKRMNENGCWKKLSAGSTFDSINSTDLSTAVIAIPKKEEQIKIGKFFKKLDNLLTLHQKELEKLKTIKKACLAKMFV